MNRLLDLHWSLKTKDKTGEFGAKLQGYFDQVTLIYPSELVPAPAVTQPGTTIVTTASGQTVVLSSSGQQIANSKNSLPSDPRTTLTAAFSYSHQINSRLQVMFLGDLVTQSGYLALPFHRYYDQTAAKYFAPYDQHSLTDQYYTSNYELSKFQSGFYGVGFRVAPPKGVFGWQNLHELEIRYGHYSQTTDLVSDVISVSLGFK